MPRRWLLRLAALALGLLPFFVCEAILRVVGSQSTTASSDPFLDCSLIRPLFVEDRPGILRIPDERLRLFARAEFPRLKSEKTKRIFALGGSTTQGEPYGPPTSFPEWLKLNLELSDPGHRFEVINAGGLSYASYRVLPILREVLDYDPDLIIVYTGQNEFLEARELSGWHRAPSIVSQAASLASKLRTIQWLRNMTGRTQSEASQSTTRLQTEVDALLDDQGGLAKYHREELDHAGVTASFRWNIERMVEACRSRNVPIVFVVPTVNLKDCPPFKYEVDPKLADGERRTVEQLWRKLNDDANAQVDVVRRILAIDPGHAGAHYLLGQRAITAHAWEEAEEHLVAAKEFDVCPLRATMAVQESVRRVAESYGVPVVDADKLFRSLSPHSLVGREWLIDHVHPTIEGHQKLGEELHRLLVDSRLMETTSPIADDARIEAYRRHLATLGEVYFQRGKQRLEGLLLWTQGRAKKVGSREGVEYAGADRVGH